MKVVFVSKQLKDPATRYRVTPLVEQLRCMGVEVVHLDDIGGVLGKLNLLWAARKARFVFVQRRLLASWLVALLPKLVFDFDDAIFCQSDGSPAVTRMRRFRSMTRAATLVIAGNAYLGRASKHANVLLAPTPVFEQQYRQKKHSGPGLTLIWVGSKSTARYLESHRGMFEMIGSAIPGLRLQVIADFDFTLEHLTVENIPWSGEAEIEHLAMADIGIAPMIDNDWTRGKCALKVLQYMAAGLPVISSAVGANQEVILDRSTGLLATTPTEWLAAVQALQDPSIRQRYGSQGYERLQQHYAGKVVLAQIVTRLVKDRLLSRAG